MSRTIIMNPKPKDKRTYCSMPGECVPDGQRRLANKDAFVSMMMGRIQAIPKPKD